MKLHLPLNLLSALLACCAVWPASVHAAPLTITENQVFDTDVTWNEDTTIGADNLTLTIESGKTLTQAAGAFNIGNNSLTITGGGIFKIETAPTVVVGSGTVSKTLTINGATLDLSSPGASLSMTGDNYTRYQVTVTNGGTLRVGEYTYDGAGLGSMAVNTEYWTLNNGRLEITKATDGTFGNGLTVAAGGGTVEVVNAASTMKITADATHYVQLNGVLTITGAGSMATDNDNVFRGDGSLIKDGAGTLTLANTSSFTGGVELKGGTLIVSHASGMGTNKNLSVTGNAAIGGISAGYRGLALSAGVSLDVSAVDENAGLTMGSGVLSLGGQNTMTGNLNLGAGTLIDAAPMTVNGNALLTLNGALTVNGSLLLENSDGVSWSAGTYNLINATGGITGDLTNTILLGTGFMGNWSTEDNVLKFVVEQVTTLTWTGGGDNTWTVGGTGNSPWNAGLAFADGNGVVFGDVTGNVPQTVTIAGPVNPKLIVVNADSTDYTWTGTGSLTGSSKLQKTGDGTLSIATDNAGFSGEVLLGGGTVEMQHANALGSGDIIFNGGSLKYGAGITADISGQIKKDALASNAILVDTNGNAVAWTALAGWEQNITRTGDGSLTLGAGTYGGKLTNSGDGSLIIGAGDSTLNGGIGGMVTKTGTGNLNLNAAAFNASDGATLVIEQGGLLLGDSNAYTSSMNIVLGSNTAMTVSHAYGKINGTGTLTMGAGSILNLYNGNSSGGPFAMNIVLDAVDGRATIAGSSNGASTSVNGTISGMGGLLITHLSNGDNAWGFNAGWVKNSYDGDTEILTTVADRVVNLTYNIGNASIVSGQTLTPWGQGNVTMGGGANSVTVTFSNLNSNTITGGVSLAGDITLKGTNAATTLNIFTGATVNVNLNGKVSVETSGNGRATIVSGDSLKVLGGLGGSGTLAVNTRNNAGALTLGGDASGFTGILNLSGANLYLNADTALAGTLNASSAKVTALRSQQVTGTLSAASLAVDGAALTPGGAILTVANLELGADAGVSLNIDGNVTAGTYTLVGWDNLTAGNFADEGSMTLTGTLADLYHGEFNVDTAGKTVSVTVSMANGVIVWDGNQIGAVDNTETYLFDGAHTGEVVLTGNMEAKAIYFNNGAGKDLELTNNGGKLSGNGAMTKLGEGKVTFNSTNNDYSGAVNIKEGTVVVKANMALGTGTVTVDRTGRLEIGVTGGIVGILGSTMPTINGGTIAFTSGGANTLGTNLANGSGINLEVMGSGTALTISAAQTKTSLTTVGEGAVLNLGKGPNSGAQSILYGNLMVNGGTLNTTAGDPFGYNNSGNFGTLTLNNGTWNVSGSNTTMASTRMVFNNSRVVLNIAGGGLNGFDLYSGTNTLVTQQSATGMSVFSVAEGAPATDEANALTLRGGTAVFDIARGNFALDDTNTADLKLDVIVATEGSGTNLVKQGNGVLQLNKASSYTNATLIKEGTILLTGAGTLGGGAVTLGGNGDAFLTYAVNGDQTVANAIGGTGTITQKGTGKVTFSGANTYAGTTNAEAGTLAAGNAAAFGTSTVSISSGATLDIGNYALKNAVSVKAGTAADALSTGAITSDGGAIGSLTLGSYSRLNVAGSLAMAAGSSFTFDMTGLSAGGTALVTLTGGLTLTGTHNLTLSNYESLVDSGDYSLLTVGTGTLTLGSFNVGELINETHPELTYMLGLSADGKTLQLKIESTADMLTWNGTEGSNTWSAGDVSNWTYAGAGAPPVSTDGQPLIFDNTAENKTVSITGDVAPSSIIVNNSGAANTYTFEGAGHITGATTILTKKGDGTLVIRTANTYGGSTSLDGGVVDINGNGALGTGSIIFGGGTLQASGNVTLTQVMVQKNAGDAVKLAASGAGTTLTVDTAGQDSFLGLNWNISGNGAVALGGIANTKVLSGIITVANGSTLNLSGGSEIALFGILKNITGTLAKTDEGSLLVKAVNGNDALGGTLSNAGGSIVLSGYGAATANRTITVNGALNADLVDVTYGVTLDLKHSQNIATLQIGGGTVGGNTQASAVNVLTGMTLTSGGVHLGGANGQGALAGNLNIIGGTAVLAGASFLDGSNSGITLSGNGTLTLGGDITGTSGTLTLGEGTLNATGAWAASAGVVLNAAAGKTATVDTTGGNITLNGAFTGSGNLLKTGTGTLGVGAASADYAGTLTLASGTLAFQNGANGYKAALNVTGGNLTGGQNYKGVKNVSVNAAAGVGSISLGSLSGSALKTINMTDAGTVISGIAGAASLDSASLVVGTGNVSKKQNLDGSASMIRFDANGTQLEIETLTLTLSADVINAMKSWGAGDRTAWFNLTNGILGYGTATFTPQLESLGFAVTGLNGGSIGITGDATQIYAVGSEDRTVTLNSELDPYRAVMVDGNLALNIPGVDNAADGLTVNNLSGAASGVINITSTNDKTASVILNNEVLGTDPNTSGPDTKYSGTINGGTANITKTGAGSLELAGTVNTGGTLEMQGGKLTLSGTADLGFIKLNSTNSGNLSSLDITGKTAAGTVTDEGNGGALSLGKNGQLTLGAAGSELSSSTISGEGKLLVADNASLALNGTSRLDGVQVDLAGNASLNLGNAANSISGLTGTGSLQNGSALEITTAGNALYEGVLSGDGSITMNGTGTQTLKGNGAAGQALSVTKGTLELIGAPGGNGSVTYKTLTAGSGTHVRLAPVGDGVDAVNTALTVTNGLNLAGSNLDLVINTNRDDLFSGPVITVQAGDVNLDGTTVSLGSLEDYDDPADPTANLNFTLVDAQGAGGTVTANGASVEASGYFDFYYQEFGIRSENGKIVVTGMVKTDNAFLGAANTANSEAGANLLWNSRGDAPKGTVLGDFREAVRNDIQSGNTSQAAHSMAAAAGSTVNALGTAQRDALREQMGWIRNRTTLMGVNPSYVNEDMPYFHMWMEGTGSYAKLDTKGDESGYQLTTWGGTVGMDVDISNHFTMGAAFTANYGDLTASAADSADGHLDSYYANLFGRYQSKRWAHTLILTGGWNDAKLNRTVNYGEGSYSTQGDTNGWGFGAMYELTYDIYLNEDKSSVLQPLFNASIVKTSMDGYTETGAGNAGLNVGKQEWTTGTVALGGRWMGLVGSNVFGREALAEFRVNAAQDMGDDRGKTGVGFLANPGYTQTVRGAKVGTTALQIGAGLSVPVGTKGTIFVNGNADIRSGANSLNGSVGYRYDF
ncbi:autotransporter-associated beta strand repeat-containing protein [Akkermansia sp.]|uniref:autotransporter-associated beta strand repeat-containing protein n=1 Tax=Akkermansia sp. TaxID=1872421 RepID=UPI0025C4612C|nr:autotransporter-associated beta strand repeat-containing protein [Akkermansia sp.]MCC8149425.1 autotransporter-associated beta strand repeat-containing protein [Akkermansia sp.]